MKGNRHFSSHAFFRKMHGTLNSGIRHPAIKRLSIAIPIAVCLGFVRSLMGFEQSALVGLCSGVFAYLAAHIFFLSHEERIAFSANATKYVRENVFSIVKYCFLVLVTISFYGMQNKPTDPLVSEIHKLVEIFGLFMVLMYPLFVLFYRTIISNHYALVGHYMGKVVTGIAVYSVVLWFLGEHGDEIKVWIVSHPNDASVAGVSFLLIWFILKLSSSSHYSYSESIERIGYAGAPALAIGVSPKLTQRDSKYVAAHESGHALVYAALGCLPPGVELVIRDNDKMQGSQGYITAIHSEHQLNEKAFNEWSMLVFLAGKYGESFAFGENTMGSENDHYRWLALAKTYLSNHFNGIFYSDPQNRFEQQNNDEKLEDLQGKQIQILANLFSENASIFHDLYNALLEKRRIDRDGLFPFLSRVVIPPNFPLPLGTFEKFSSDWPESVGFYTYNDKSVSDAKECEQSV